MPDNLRITTPVANTEGISRPNPAGDLNRPVPVNPSRVPRPDNGEETGRQAGDLLLNRSSVFSQFIRQLAGNTRARPHASKASGRRGAAADGPSDGQTSREKPCR